MVWWLCFCVCVCVVVRLRFCVFVSVCCVVVWWCFCGGVFVLMWLCFCGLVVVFLCFWFGGCVFGFLWWFGFFLGGVVVSLCWCGCVLCFCGCVVCFCAFVARTLEASVGEECWGESVVEGCCREVLEKRVGMCCRVWEVLEKRVVEKLRRVL